MQQFVIIGDEEPDDSPYPLPPEKLVLIVGRQIHRSLSEFTAGLAKACNVIIQAYEPLMKLEEKEIPPIKGQVGPRRGPTYDHRGRRRW